MKRPPAAAGKSLLTLALLFNLNSVASMGGGFSLPWQEIQRVRAADVELGADFGSSVALDRDRALIGARAATWGPGAAYVYRRDGDEWVEEQKLVASDGAFDDRFGGSVALDGDVAVIGATEAEVNGNVHQGAAYIFERIGGIWLEQQKLIASDGLKQDRFGSAVAIEGETIMVSAPSDDIGANLGQGSVYVFGRVAGAWVEQQKVVIADGQASDLLGQYHIVIDGDRAVVGAPSATVGGVVNKGAAYVLAKEAGVWVEEARLTPAGVGVAIGFGRSVSLDDARVVAGATDETVTHEAQGTAYIFERVGDVWIEGQRLVATDAHENARFGVSSATSSVRVLVGGTFDTIGNPNRGAAYSYRRDGTGVWVEEQRVTPSDSIGVDGFATSIALELDRLLVGATGNPGGGAAYFFQRTPVFADGFESGDTSAWDQSVPAGCGEDCGARP